MIVTTTPPAFIEFYDKWSDIYSDVITVNAQFSIPAWINENAELLLEGKRSVLELGCADGFIGKKVRQLRPFYQFDGIDVSPKMVEVASKIYDRCFCHDLNTGLPREINENFYDLVVATSVLEFVLDHEKRFLEVVSVLKSKGQFWLTVEKEEPSSVREVFGLQKVLYPNPQTIQSILHDCGFQVIKIEELIGYISPSTQKSVNYFFIIAEKNS